LFLLTCIYFRVCYRRSARRERQEIDELESAAGEVKLSAPNRSITTPPPSYLSFDHGTLTADQTDFTRIAPSCNTKRPPQQRPSATHQGSHLLSSAAQDASHNLSSTPPPPARLMSSHPKQPSPATLSFDAHSASNSSTPLSLTSRSLYAAPALSNGDVQVKPLSASKLTR